MDVNIEYEIEINASEQMGMLEALAKSLQTEMINGRVVIPKEYGQGYLQGFVFNNQLRMMISDYELKQDLNILRVVGEHTGNRIMISFRNIFKSGQKHRNPKASEMPSVFISTQGLTMGMNIPRNSTVQSVLLAIDADYLKKMIALTTETPLMQTIFDNKQPLIFEQLPYASLQKTADEISAARIPENFMRFFYRIKAEELICNLFIELSKRDQAIVHPLNTADIKALYTVRDRITMRFDQCPSISELAAEASMSESKLQRLFKQVFDKTVFNYFQSFRMHEAARLLIDEGLSVSETGYQLGFTNLSHFTRVFEESHGLKPKRFIALKRSDREWP